IVYEKLKNAILSYDLNPYQYYTEEDLAKTFGTSRTPVREVVQVLIEKKLLVATPRKGVRIRKFNDFEIDQIFMIREAFENIILEKSLITLTKTEVEKMKDILEKQKKAALDNDKRSFIN